MGFKSERPSGPKYSTWRSAIRNPNVMSENDTAQPGSCLFCGIAKGQIKSHVVFENPSLLAFLDVCPIRPGHVQIIPRAHFSYFEDLPPDLVSQVIGLGQRIAKAQKRLYGVKQVAFLFTGGDIPHAHAHLVPMIEKTDITSRQYIKEDALTFEPIPNAPTAELRRTASELRRALQEF